MKIADLMQRSPPTVGPDATVGEVARVMTEKGKREIVVVEGNRVAGIITAADLVAKHAMPHFPKYFSLLGYSVPIESHRDDREIERALATTARELMTSEPVTISAEDDVDQAATLLLDRNVSCLPVLAAGHLAGLIDESDFVRLLDVEESE
jgi:CBS domain-containing protein